MKVLLLLAVTLSAVAAACNTKLYKIRMLEDSHSGTFKNLIRNVYNKENFLANCNWVPYFEQRRDYYQQFLNGSDRNVYGKRKRDISLIEKGKWTNAVVPFLVEQNVFSECALTSLATAMTYWEETTCIRFASYVDSEKTPRPLIVANVLSNKRNPFASRSRTADFEGIGSFDASFLGTNDINMREPYTMLHELGHILMLLHPEDSPRSRAPYRGRNPTNVGRTDYPWYPLSVSTNLRINGTSPGVPTDWDIWTLNAFYNCTKTTRGDKPIDIRNQPPKHYLMDK